MAPIKQNIDAEAAFTFIITPKELFMKTNRQRPAKHPKHCFTGFLSEKIVRVWAKENMQLFLNNRLLFLLFFLLFLKIFWGISRVLGGTLLPPSPPPPPVAENQRIVSLLWYPCPHKKPVIKYMLGLARLRFFSLPFWFTSAKVI